MPTVRIPLAGSPTNRGSSPTKDQRFINCYPEVVKNEITQAERIYLQKRFGTSKLVQPTGATGVARGIFSWNNFVWVAIGTGVYRVNSAGTATLTQTLTTSTGAVGFTDVHMTNDYLVVLDGTRGYYISTTNISTQITDVDFPSTHIPTPVFMDGYLFVQKTTGEIFNSDINNVSSWNATNFLSPEIFPDTAIGLARQNNQVVAFGASSVEFFYDAANASGSPLSSNSQAVLQFGCASMTSVAQQEGLLAFVGQSDTGGKFVVAVDGFEPHNISNTSIEKIIEAEGNNIGDCWGYFARVKGHFFYVLNLPSNSRTLVYDFVTKMWHEWDFTANSSTYALFPMLGVAELADNAYFLHSADGYVYKARVDLYQDATQTLRTQVQTGRYDGETTKRKFMSRLELIADYQSTGTVSLYVSDDDYQNWHGNRTLDLTKRAYVYRLGAFRRRAFLLTHTANTDFRAEALEFEIEVGVH